MSVDAIILAAGRNERLSGVVPSYMKPTILINGVPVITKLISQCASVIPSLGRIIVVASPYNVAQIIDLSTAWDVTYVIQPKPVGTLDALRRGMAAATADRVVLLCADNAMSDHVIRQCAVEKGTIVGCQLLPTDESLRFTRVSGRGVFEGPFVQEENIQDSRTQLCWIGPVGFSREQLRVAMEWSSSERVSSMIDACKPYAVIESDAIDIGVPGMLGGVL